MGNETKCINLLIYDWTKSEKNLTIQMKIDIFSAKRNLLRHLLIKPHKTVDQTKMFRVSSQPQCASAKTAIFVDCYEFAFGVG